MLASEKALSVDLTSRAGIHPPYRASLRRIICLLGLLLVVQYLSWLSPAPLSFQGIPQYLLLHSVMEMFSVVISMMVFIVGWNAHANKTPAPLAILASIFFAVGALDFFHTFSYVGMPDFISPNDSDKHLNFWLSARILVAIGLLVVASRSWDRLVNHVTKYLIFLHLLAVTIFVCWLVLYHQPVLPHWFIPGQGLTPLKKGAEYLVIFINLVTIVILWRKMREPQQFNAALLFGAVAILAMSEVFFTLYANQTSAYSVLGHIYKAIGYFLIYRSVVVETIERPYRELESARENLQLAVTASNTGLWDLHPRTGESYLSPVLKAQLGYDDAELLNQHATWLSLLHPDDREKAIGQLKEYMARPDRRFYEAEFRMRHKDGSYRWILSRGEKQFNERGQVLRLVGSHTDITERKREANRFQSAVEASPNAMIMVDDKGSIVLANSRADSMFGYEPGSLVGTSLDMLVPDAMRGVHERLLQGFKDAASDHATGEGRAASARHRAGHEFRVEIGLTPIAGQDGCYLLASVVDITSRVEAQQRIEKLINYDVLTGLPNRQLLKHRVDHALGAAVRAQKRVAILFLDLDNFKYINDTLSHKVGDQLLVEVAGRLSSHTQEADTVARVGSDEFVIVLTEGEEDAVAREATRILAEVSRRYRIEGQELIVTPSIGIAMFPDDGADFETLLQHADTAMHRVKHDGRNDFRFFAKEMQLRTMRLMQLESAMYQALDRQQFQLVYQPQYAMDGHKLVGVEALLRWNHPDLGQIAPAEFIPLAESNGQIISIGSWVLRTAVSQMKTWLNAGLPPMVMAVNLSAVQFRHVNLPALVTQILSEAEMRPEYLELELTESVAMESPMKAIEVMDDLHRRGVRMSIDDFGTGYSSLSYLKKFNVYKLKIDQSFVRDITTDAGDLAIVTAIIQLAHSLGFITIAEGVETQAQYDFLRAQGCNEFQGHLFSKPLPPDQLIALIAASVPLGTPD
jgi:diguanylate cyclase (GGDEF)-like protein/PAS domain S-box-containing protein